MRLNSLFRFISAGVGFALLFPLTAGAGDPSLAPVPPMGWNSWDAYGQAITEAQVRANADWMAKHLKQFGWQYVVIDEGWYLANPGSDPKDYKLELSNDGRFVPTATRFPSAAGGAGFRPLADYVHSLGLKFGASISFEASPAKRSPGTCPSRGRRTTRPRRPIPPIPVPGTPTTMA